MNTDKASLSWARDLQALVAAALLVCASVAPSFATSREASAHERIRFRVEGLLIATDNGHPTDMTSFPSHRRAAFSGLALAIVRAQPGRSGTIVVRAGADGLQAARARIVLDEAQDLR